MSDATLRQLEYFIAAVEEGSVTAASQRLMVGCYSTLSPVVLPRTLDEYVERFPGVALSFSEGSHDLLIDKLRNGSLDVALLYDYGPDVATHRGDLNFEVIFTAPPYVLLAEDHPLADRESVSLAQLIDEPLILFSLSPGGDYFVSLFHTEQLEPRVRYRATSFELVRSLVARGLGYSILSQRTRISVSYEGRGFTTRPLDGAKLTRPAAAFIETCRTAFEYEDRTHGQASPRRS